MDFSDYGTDLRIVAGHQLAVLGFRAVIILSEMLGRHMFFVDVLSFVAMFFFLEGLISMFNLLFNQVLVRFGISHVEIDHFTGIWMLTQESYS